MASLPSELSRLLFPILSSKPARTEFERVIDSLIERAEAEHQRRETEEQFKKEKGDRITHAEEMARCANGVEGLLYWFENWAWTFDPRLIAENKTPYVRFKPWPKQREFLIWLHERVSAGRPWLLEKSRDQGATYLIVGYAVWRWLFTPGFKTTFCSRDELNVDAKGNPDSIFEKLRIIYRRLPVWMLPEGFNERRHDNVMQLTNPQTGAIITGETGDNPGRGGRSSMYVVDEAAFLAHPAKVEAATSGNTDCIGWVSTPNPEAGGLANFFARKRAALAALLTKTGQLAAVFRLHWTDDPRKTQVWADEKKANMADPTTWEAEYEISYTAATEGVAIPAKWVQSAVLLGRMYGAQIPRAKKGITGGDVGAGKAKSVCCHRFGPLVLALQRRQEADTTDTAYWMLDCMVEAGTDFLNFDAPGVGAGVLSTLSKIDRAKYPTLRGAHGVNTGLPPTGRIWPDETSSQQKFGNLKAELWWLARGAFQRSHLHLCFLLQKQQGAAYKGDQGKEQDWNEIVVIQDDATLQMQLSTPKWFRNEKGLIVIETKKQLAMRKIPSPDDADAFVLTYLEENTYSANFDTDTLRQDNPFVVQ